MMGNIFISSTFKDLNRERTFIKDHIGAQLNGYAEKYAEQYYFTDLRVGVEDTQNNYETINICLTRIKEAAPPDPFIVIVGNSRGWIPAAEDLQQAIDHLPPEDEDIKEMLRQCKDAGKSITELEIAYGAEGLGCEDAAAFGKRTLFLMMPEAEHCENAALRQRILKNFPEQCTPMDLEHPQKAEEMLQAIIDRAHAGQKALNPLQRERKQHLDYMKLKAESFFGREALCAAITEDLAQGDGYVYLYGPSGIGKSSLVSKIAGELSESMEILPIYCGLTEKTDSAANVIEMILAYLKEKMPQFQSDPEELLIDQYQRASEAYLADENTPPILIAIDAIDQLKPDEYQERCRFLPMEGNPKLRFLFSGTENGAEIQSRYTGLRELDENQRFHLHPVEGFGKEETAQILTYIFDKELKKGSLPHLVAERLEKSGISNPLYLKMIALRLANLSNRELRELQACSDRGEKYMELIDRFTLDEKKQLLPMEQVCLNLLHAACGEKEALLDTLQLIALTRHGLPISFIKELEPQGFKEEDFYVLTYRLRNLFFRHQDGSEDFTHKIFRRALDQTMAPKQKEENYKRIARGLKEEIKKNASFAESIFIYHCVKAEDARSANSYIYQNTPKKADAPKERQKKQMRLDFAWENLLRVDAEELFPLWEKAAATVSLENFCIERMETVSKPTVERLDWCASVFATLIFKVGKSQLEKALRELEYDPWRAHKGWEKVYALFLQTIRRLKKYRAFYDKYKEMATDPEDPYEKLWDFNELKKEIVRKINESDKGRHWYSNEPWEMQEAESERLQEAIQTLEVTMERLQPEFQRFQFSPKKSAEDSAMAIKEELEKLIGIIAEKEEKASEYILLFDEKIQPDCSDSEKKILLGTVMNSLEIFENYIRYYGLQRCVSSSVQKALDLIEGCPLVQEPQQYRLDFAKFLIAYYQEMSRADLKRFETVRQLTFFEKLPQLKQEDRRVWVNCFLSYLELAFNSNLPWEDGCWSLWKNAKQLLKETALYEEYESELFKCSLKAGGALIHFLENSSSVHQARIQRYLDDLKADQIPLQQEAKRLLIADLEDFINEKQQHSKEFQAYMDRLEHAKGEELEEIFKTRPKYRKWKHKHFKEVLI